MMKLEEAINHCEEVALSCAKSNRECALEHVQLMQWLKELRVLRQLVKPEYLQEIRGLQKTWGKEWEEYFNRALCYDVTGPFAGLHYTKEWKPSDEQMKELSVAKDSCFDLSYKTKNILKSLYNDLKRLREK